jgi:hypothetical protein
MTPLLEAARDLQTFLEERNWRFAIIGGLALLRWGEARFTRDVDVSLLCGFGREDEFISPFFASVYRGRISDAAAFARRNPVLLLEAPSGVPACSNSLLNARYGPARRRTDVESVVMRRGSELDWDYIERQLAPLEPDSQRRSEFVHTFTKPRA